MDFAKTVSQRSVQIGLLAASVVTLVITGPGAANALAEIATAPFTFSGMAAATGEAAEPQDPALADAVEDAVAPFFLSAANPGERAQAVKCLSDAVYYEASNEPEDGQRAVAQVVLNRVRDQNFPDTVCGVVYQGWYRKTGCQFSFVCDGSLVRRPPSEEDRARATAVAAQALNGYVATAVGTATHYHTDYVNPYWSSSVVKVAKLGVHIFYRWPGNAGEVAALNQPYAGGEVGFWNAAAQQSPQKFARGDA